jgi:hypothetical protein
LTKSLMECLFVEEEEDKKWVIVTLA